MMSQLEAAPGKLKTGIVFIIIVYIFYFLYAGYPSSLSPKSRIQWQPTENLVVSLSIIIILLPCHKSMDNNCAFDLSCCSVALTAL